MSSISAPPLPEDETLPAARGAFEDFWRRFRRDYIALAAVCLIVFTISAAVFGAPLAAWLTGHQSALLT